MIGNTFFFEWEVALIEWIQSWLGSFGTAVSSVFTMLGEQMICVAFLGFIYWCWDKKLGRYVGMNILVAITLNTMIKNIFVRRRPYFDHKGIKCLKPAEKGADIYDISAQGFSFPSGHSTNSVTIYTSIGIYSKNKILMTAGIVLPLLIGISRFCLGVHYPTDVICGWLLGLIVVLLVPLLQKLIKNRLVFYGIIILITIPGLFYCRSQDYYTAFGSLAGFILAIEFDDKLVNFENTNNPLRCILRVALGIGVYLCLNTLLKLPFSSDFLSSSTVPAYLVRAARSCVVIFVTIGVYPLAFRLGDRIFGKGAKKE